LTAGQTHESTVVDTLLIGADANVVDGQGEPIAWPVALVGDKGYRADWIDDYLLAFVLVRGSSGISEADFA